MKNNLLKNDEIEFRVLLKKIIENIKLILIVTAVTTTFFYFVSLNEEKKLDLKAHIVVTNKLPKFSLLKYQTEDLRISGTADREIASYLENELINNVHLNLSSTDILQKFVNQNQNISEFKNFLKKNNISPKKYFFNKFGIYNEDLNRNALKFKYYLNFPQNLNGVVFLNEYVKFVKKLTIEELKPKIKVNMENDLEFFQRNYDIAKDLNFIEPVVSNPEITIMTNHASQQVYVQGTKIISFHIQNLKYLIQELENDPFDFNIIVDSAIIVSNGTNVKVKYIILGILVGIFLSLLIIFFKDFFILNYKNSKN